MITIITSITTPIAMPILAVSSSFEVDDRFSNTVGDADAEGDMLSLSEATRVDGTVVISAAAELVRLGSALEEGVVLSV